MMKYNEKYNIIVRRSDGYFFQYESEKWAILSVEGADFTKIEVFKEPRGFGNGDIITGKRKLSREVSITVVARDIEEYPLIRDEIMQTFSQTVLILLTLVRAKLYGTIQEYMKGKPGNLLLVN